MHGAIVYVILIKVYTLQVVNSAVMIFYCGYNFKNLTNLYALLTFIVIDCAHMLEADESGDTRKMEAGGYKLQKGTEWRRKHASTSSR